MIPVPLVSSSDPEALALLIALRDHPDNREPTLQKMFSDAIASITLSTASTGALESSPVQETVAAPSTFPLVPFIRIDTSGKEGDNGFPGAAASHPEAKGLKGKDGTQGKNATDINLRLRKKDGLIAAEWDQGTGSLKMDGTAGIVLRAVGGRGGRGGNGGRGGVGVQGAQGANATRYSVGENGKRGTPGGIGGNSGSGGNGGNGGSVKVYVSPDETDLLMLFNTPDVASGLVGKAGTEGKGGVGGPGGAGGLSCTWSEMRTGTRTVYDGRGHSRTETYTYTVSRYNPGGHQGPQGQNGQDGRTGNDGRAGLAGAFQIIVGEALYQQLYDLAVTVSKIVNARGAAGFYEPGEQVHMQVSVHNIGGMPTPFCPVEISLQSTEWMERDASLVVLKESLPSQSSHIFEAPFSFRINDQLPCIGAPLKRQEIMTFQAYMPSVNKSFQNVSQQKESITIRYPVELTVLAGKTSIVFDEKVTLTLHVQNTTTEIFQKRRVYVVFEITETEEVKSDDVELVTGDIFDEGNKNHERNKVAFEIGHLAAKSQERIAVSFRFTNPETKPRSKVGVTASLYLEYVNTDRVRCIQKRTMEISLSEGYRHNPQANLLLVTHSGVAKEELEAWDSCLRGMQLVYSIWNVSYYNHLNFSGDLESHFTTKTVIILNQSVGGSSVLELMPKREIFRIGKYFNINTYIIGEKTVLKEQSEISLADTTEVASETLHGRVMLESNLKEEFEKEVKAFAVRVRLSNPMGKYVIVKSFASQKTEGMFKHVLGTVKACPTGKLNRASVLMIESKSIGPRMIHSPQNRYAILKMLHFERKLSLLGSIPKPSRQLLEDAILSDLVDEQYFVAQAQWTNESAPALKRNLELLNLLAATQFIGNDELKVSVRRVFLQFRAFVNVVFIRPHLAAQVAEEEIDRAIRANCGDAWKDEYLACYYEPLSKLPHQDVWGMMRNPRFNSFYQDNWEGRSPIKSLEELG